MVTFVFNFRYDAALVPAALDELRAKLPLDTSIIPKTQTVVVVSLPADAEVGALKDMQRAFGSCGTSTPLHTPRLDVLA